MPKFKYIALNTDSEIVKSEDIEDAGFVEALDRSAVYALLNARGWRPVLVDALKPKIQMDLDVQLKWWVSLSELAMFCKVMHILIKAGITILETLQLVNEECENKWFKKRLTKLQSNIESGAKFSDALRKYPEAFPDIMVAVVEAGECSGSLETCLDQMSAMFHRAAELKRELVSALTYPAFIVVTFIGMITAVMIMVPRLLVSFLGNGIEKVKHQLPPAIQLTFWVQDHWWVLCTPLLIALIFIILALLAKKFGGLRLFLSKGTHKIPLIGKTIFSFALVRTLEIFCLLENAGVEPLRSLRTMINASGHPMIEDAMERVIVRVRKGAPRYASIAAEPVFPRLMVSMWQSGERAGNIVMMLRQVSEYYYLMATAATQRMITAIEPIMIIGIAFCIGPFIVGIYQSLQIMMKNIG